MVATDGHAPFRERAGVLVAIEQGRDGAPLVGHLGPELTLRIRRALPRSARLVFAHGARFVLALPGDPLLEALLLVDRVRDALDREDWRLDGETVALTFTAGVSTRHGVDEPLAETLDAAVRSLEQARRRPVEPTAPARAATAARRPGGDAWTRVRALEP